MTVPLAKGLLNRLADSKPDVVVAELGDGILGEYGVQDILSTPTSPRVARRTSSRRPIPSPHGARPSCIASGSTCRSPR